MIFISKSFRTIVFIFMVIFYLTVLIIGSHIVFISILGLLSRIQRPKRCENKNNNKDEENSPKTLTDKNHQASSQKFRQLISQACCNRWLGYVVWFNGISNLNGYLMPNPF